MIKLIKCPYSRKKKQRAKQWLLSFMKKEKLLPHLDAITIDWTPQKTVNTYGGYYGGFFSLYNNRKAYINLTVFYELENLNNMREILWAVFHELIHCKQMATGEISINEKADTLIYKGQEFKKLTFRGKKFLELYEKDRFSATEYHIAEIPWEGECYYKSDLYTGLRSFNHQVYLNT